MVKGRLLAQIRELIEEGYDTDENLETISFEYDIKIEDLQNMRSQIQKEKIAKNKEERPQNSIINEYSQNTRAQTQNEKVWEKTQNSIINEYSQNTRAQTQNEKVWEKTQNSIINEYSQNSRARTQNEKVASTNNKYSQNTRNKILNEGIDRSKEDVLRYSVTSKCSQIRINYYRLYNGDEQPKSTKKINSSDNSSLVENVIKDINRYKGEDCEKVMLERNIQGAIDRIKKEHISTEQAYRIFSSVEDIKKSHVIALCRTYIIGRLIEAVGEEERATTDIERLKYLSSMLSSSEYLKNNIIAQSTKMRIDKKIDKIKLANTQSKILSRVSDDMEEIISNVISSDCDMLKLEDIIQREIKNRIEKSPKTKFALNEKQHRAQIYYELTKALDVHGDKYMIQKPMKTMDVLDRAFAMGFDSNVRAVVRNYITRNEYKKAEELCGEFSSKLEEFSPSANAILRLRDEIRRAEIGSIILRGIKSEATEEELSRFCGVIKERLSSQISSLKLIPLGKNKDGTRVITLADVWDDKTIGKERVT